MLSCICRAVARIVISVSHFGGRPLSRLNPVKLLIFDLANVAFLDITALSHLVVAKANIALVDPVRRVPVDRDEVDTKCI
jgi:hypothetical protein